MNIREQVLHLVGHNYGNSYYHDPMFRHTIDKVLMSDSDDDALAVLLDGLASTGKSRMDYARELRRHLELNPGPKLIKTRGHP